MGHELRPRTAELFTVLEIARRLRAEFRDVRVDLDEGSRFAIESAQWIETRPASFFENPIPAIAARRKLLRERAKTLRALAPGLAARFTFGDPGGLKMDFVFVPGDMIMFGYQGAADEEQRRPLVDRCARALDCDVVLF